mgnify:CR=1 FL=1
MRFKKIMSNAIRQSTKNQLIELMRNSGGTRASEGVLHLVNLLSHFAFIPCIGNKSSERVFGDIF